jgi:hypothetical protein
VMVIWRLPEACAVSSKKSARRTTKAAERSHHFLGYVIQKRSRWLRSLPSREASTIKIAGGGPHFWRKRCQNENACVWAEIDEGMCSDGCHCCALPD